MPEWDKQIIAVNLIVADLDRSSAFYSKVFGMRPQHEDGQTVMFRFKGTYVFLHQVEGHDDTPVGEVLDLAKKGVGQFAIIVADVDAVRAELDHHQVALISGPTDRDWGMRTMTFPIPTATSGRSCKNCPAPRVLPRLTGQLHGSGQKPAMSSAVPASLSMRPLERSRHWQRRRSICFTARLRTSRRGHRGIVGAQRVSDGFSGRHGWA